MIVETEEAEHESGLQSGISQIPEITSKLETRVEVILANPFHFRQTVLYDLGIRIREIRAPHVVSIPKEETLVGNRSQLPLPLPFSGLCCPERHGKQRQLPVQLCGLGRCQVHERFDFGEISPRHVGVAETLCCFIRNLFFWPRGRYYSHL